MIISTSIADVTSPTANCPSSQFVNANVDGNTKAVVTWIPASCADNSQWNVRLYCTDQPGKKFGLGNTTVQCTCTDREGNEGECFFNIIVKGRYKVFVNVPSRTNILIISFKVPIKILSRDF